MYHNISALHKVIIHGFLKINRKGYCSYTWLLEGRDIATGDHTPQAL